MQATALLQYPEFMLAALLTLVYVRYQIKKPELEQFRLPKFLGSLAQAFMALLPKSYGHWLLRKLNWAGFRTNNAFVNLCALKIGMIIIGLLSAFLVPLHLVPFLVCTLFFVPDLLLMYFVRKRQQQIRESLPQALDLMVLCVDAGLGLDATLQRVSMEQTVIAYALNEELAALNRDILLGMERERAYQELYKRTGVEELKMLGSALYQSTKMGFGIARILRIQSEFLRTRQNQQAEEAAVKLPVWMAFPLWFCIMPALMLIVIGPSLITFLRQIPGLSLTGFQ